MVAGNLLGLLLWSTFTITSFGLGFGVLFIVCVLKGIYEAKKHRTMVGHNLTTGEVSITNARTWGLIASILFLLPLIMMIALYWDEIDSRDIVPGLVFLLSGATSLYGAFAYKVVEGDNAPQLLICPSCGQTMPMVALYCPSCGHPRAKA